DERRHRGGESTERRRRELERRDRRNDIEKREERDRRERDRALEGARYTYDSRQTFLCFKSGHNEEHRRQREEKERRREDRDQQVEGEEQVEQEYEDDFEEYEEDFEEMEESENEGEEKKEPQHPRARWKKEIEAIQRAMDEENSRVESAQSPQMSKDQEDERKPSRASEKSQTQAPHRRSFIDFVAAKQREVSRKVTAKQKKRSAELLRLIDLDFSVAFSVLDLPPVNQYDMYIRSFGTANTRQAYTQCNEDNVDRDVQTEETEISQRWTQHPPEHGGACGEAPNKAHSEIDFDSQRLTSFLQSASQGYKVMVVLLEEEQAERESLRRHGSPADTMSFSDGSSRLNTGIPFLHGRGVSQVLAQRNTLMTVHVPAASHSDALLDDCTLICIWNIWEPSRPQKVLVYESEVRCCCFSPGKATLVFAGTSVGSVVLWDLRECASDHYRLTIEEEEWTFRQPTFSTDAVMASSGHFSPVTSIEAVPSAAAGELRSEVPLLASQEESSGLSFQLASLDETGLLNIWVVLEDLKANQAGSPSDLGLRPGGKVRLLHSSSILTVDRSSRDAATTGFFQTLHLKFLPTDSNHFFTGTNMGLVNHGTSHGLKATPRFYRFQEVGARPVDVTQIHFSPFKQHLFLVGCGDGSVRLHEVRNEQPVAEWRSSRGPVVALQWSHTRPGLFCVLDAASNFYIWDLLKSTTQPVITEKIHSDRVTAMAAFGDSGQNLYSGVVLAHQSGTIELQYFTAGFSTPSPAEVEKLESMVNQ
uniref:Dynein 2 intermediate chain 1 n=1 Tax=Tetraodon nigroviridis TaxID=99883 RepID=H3CJY9_TETNG